MRVLLLIAILFVCGTLSVCLDGKIYLAESIPQNLTLPDTPVSIYSRWMKMITNAKYSLSIAGFYFTLTGGSQYPGYDGYKGQDIYDALIDASKRNVSIRIVQSKPTEAFPDTDTLKLAKMGVVELRNIDWEGLVGAGILHSKFMVSDNTSMYIGSANWDWRALAQIKELGVVIEDCPQMAQDLGRVFEQYWMAAALPKLPIWPSWLQTPYNDKTPAQLHLNNTLSSMYISVSPPVFQAPGRIDDLAVVIESFDTAKDYISLSIMDYAPFSVYADPPFYWPTIDTALRNASFRGVKVNLLFSIWPHTIEQTKQYMYSLDALDNIQVKFFIIPELEHSIPFTRVSHSKYFVTDQVAYVTTSNWTPDYFQHTGGVTAVVKGDLIVSSLTRIFNEDFNGPYAIDLK